MKSSLKNFHTTACLLYRDLFTISISGIQFIESANTIFLIHIHIKYSYIYKSQVYLDKKSVFFIHMRILYEKERVIMDELNKVFRHLKHKYKISNQEKLSQLTNVSQPTIGRYLQSAENIKKMRLETFFKLFPEAEILFKESKNQNIKTDIKILIDNLSEENVMKAQIILKTFFED